MKSLSLCAVLFSFLTLSVAGADTALETSMKKMEKAAKQLGADLKLTDDTKHNKEVDLQSVATIKSEGTKSRDQVPKKAKALPADQQQTMSDNFKKDMDTFIQHTDTLAQDIQTDNWNAARTDFQNLMKEQHDDHKLYRVKK